MEDAGETEVYGHRRTMADITLCVGMTVVVALAAIAMDAGAVATAAFVLLAVLVIVSAMSHAVPFADIAGVDEHWLEIGVRLRRRLGIYRIQWGTVSRQELKDLARRLREVSTR